MEFLYGPDHLNQTTVEMKKKKEEEEEELDEDDLEDIVEGGGNGGDSRSPGVSMETLCSIPRLRHNTQGYRGAGAEGQGVLQRGGSPPSVRETGPETQSLRNIVGPLRLTMTDISSDLNNLVRTFRNSWRACASVGSVRDQQRKSGNIVLPGLSEVSPLVREALESPTSVEYLSILMRQLSLQDLQSLVATQNHSHPVSSTI